MKSLSLKKVLSVFACFAIVLFAGIIFAACGAPKTLWKGDLSKEGVFNDANGYYGEVTLNKDGTVTLTPTQSGSVYTAANTYFGEEDKNYDWREGGMSVSFTVDVKAEDLTAGNALVWSLALNEKQTPETETAQASDYYRYLTELAVFFVGTDDGVKFVYAETGVDQTDYTALVAGDDAASLTDGKYTVTYDFGTNKDGYVTVVVTLENSKGKEVYSSEEATFDVIDSHLYENGSAVKEEMVEGLRYLWCVRVTSGTPVTVSSVKVTE